MNASFITGVDHNHEWMLEWWFNNIRKHSSLPITLCDFGMSEERSNWAQQNATHFIKYAPHPKCAWFHKTQCLVDSPYENTCWIDSDCEVLTNIDGIFNYGETGKIGLTRDVGRGKDWWATGVVVIKGKPTFLQEWNKISKEGTLRGDQEAFKHLLQLNNNLEEKVVEIPLEYQWLRLQLLRGQDNPNKKVIHWTGPHGKNHIRNLI